MHLEIYVDIKLVAIADEQTKTFKTINNNELRVLLIKSIVYENTLE